MVAVIAALALAAGPANAGWGSPVRIAAPFTLDVLPPALGFSSSGAAAVVFGVQDHDAPATSSGYAVWRTAGGAISRARQVPNTMEALDAAFNGQTAEVLTGTSPTTQTCCQTVGVVQLTSGGSFRGGQTLVRNLVGQPVGELVGLGGRVLAAVASRGGVWVSQSGKGARFAAAHRLTGGDAVPEALSAVPLPKGGAVVAWTQTTPGSRFVGPGGIYLASGSQKQAPTRAHEPVRLSGGRLVDELVVTAATPATTLAWTEHSYDTHGNYVSDAAVMDLVKRRLVKRFALGGAVASGLTFASDTRGDQVLAWKTCNAGGACAVRASVRSPGRQFTAPVQVGAIDGTDAPVAAVSPHGVGLLAWISGGHVFAVSLARGATRFSASHEVSNTQYADALDLSFSSTGYALAVWSQGTLNPEVVGAVFRP
jgi:hypothetical protein